MSTNVPGASTVQKLHEIVAAQAKTFWENVRTGGSPLSEQSLLAEAEKLGVDLATLRDWIKQPDYLAEFDEALAELNMSRQAAWDACTTMDHLQQEFLRQILPMEVTRTRGPASQSFFDIIANLPGNREYIEILRQQLAWQERTADLQDLERLVYFAGQLFGDAPFFTVTTEKQITNLLRAKYGVDSASLSIYDVAKVLESEVTQREKAAKLPAPQQPLPLDIPPIMIFPEVDERIKPVENTTADDASPGEKDGASTAEDDLSSDSQRLRAPLKPPTENAIAVYRYQLLMGKTQQQLADDTELMRKLRKKVSQGTISRWLASVENWIKAGNILPDLPGCSKARPMDPQRIDFGKRQDGRTHRQRGRRSGDEA